MPDRPDAQKFLTDPAFQGDRELMFAVFDARLKHHVEEAKAKKPDSIIAQMFAALMPTKEGAFSFFDDLMGGRKP